MTHANIVATGSYVPEIKVTNDDLRARFDATAPDFVNKMEASTGILTRWWAPDDVVTSDLAVRAAHIALERAGKTAEDIDLIIVGTDSPDYITPATSVIVQGKLGARNAGTFDVGCACASFPTAFASAAGMMATSPHLRTVLVIGVYLMHKLTSADDPMVFFYGDGAGAAVLEQREERGFISSAFRADGTYAPRWAIHAGGTVEPATEIAVREGRARVKMYERYPPEINNTGWPLIVRQVAKNGGFEVSDIDFTIFTQVRKPTIELVMKDLGLPMSKTHMIMETVGYTGSACIPMALDDALRQRKIKPGDLVVLVGSGVGYNQAATAFRVAEDGARLFG
ncbi:MAG: 3-oxoacyl-[acyl-carrier-protein] synthase [Thermoanaerobaculia bacterium]|jgi:3-oxoacyl-[acyl-carrier-protein] synthase-3|nr:3-oxoacyl-[acyl-carrier-protein] synthase [Thermoanaerobaculia bacterium]